MKCSMQCTSAGKEISYIHNLLLWMGLLKFIGPDANCIIHKKRKKNELRQLKFVVQVDFREPH